MTEETTYLLTRPGTIDDPAAQEAIDRLAAFWDTVNREDVAIVQRVPGAACLRATLELARRSSTVHSRHYERRTDPR